MFFRLRKNKKEGERDGVLGFKKEKVKENNLFSLKKCGLQEKDQGQVFSKTLKLFLQNPEMNFQKNTKTKRG